MAIAWTISATVCAELQGQLDSKHARVGQGVVLRATSAWYAGNGLNVPVGAKLTGRVAQVIAQGSGHADGQLTILLERAEWKGNRRLMQRVQIQAEIEAIEPAVERPNSFAMNAPMVGGWGKTESDAKPGVAVASSASTIRPVASSTGPDAVASSAAKSLGDASPAVGLNDAMTAQVELASSETLLGKATGIKGVFVAGDAPGVSSGTIFAKGKNLYLDSGTVFTLALTSAAK
jgi:hypothetical protein